MEVAVGCPLETKQILTDPMVINKIQTGCDMAIDQAVNLSHVIELCDFPSTLKTSDLDDVLHQLKLEKYYELIWVDDTHAIAVMVSCKNVLRDILSYFNFKLLWMPIFVDNFCICFRVITRPPRKF